MAKALFLSLPLAGHVNPSLALVRELVRRGDQVIYYATAPFADRIQQAGAQYRPYENSFLADLRELPSHLHELSWLLMRTTAELLETHLEPWRSECPDYLVTDSVAPWGHWTAQILSLPVITSVSTFAVNRHVLAYAAARGIRPRSPRLFFAKLRHILRAVQLGRQLRVRYGVSGPGITGLVMGSSGLNLVYTSHQFQPCADTFDKRFHFIGPSLADRGEAAVFPWEQIRFPVLVYVSLGTLFNADVSFYRNCFDAFQGENFQVILSIGPQVSRASLGTPPANFLVQTHVPQLQVLARAHVFVTHGGMNSVSEGLWFGVPLLVVPQMSEQAMVGRRVEELGAGMYLPPEQVTPERLRQAVRTLLSSGHFRRQAAAIRESFQTTAGVSHAADVIGGLCSNRGRPV